MVNDPSGRQGSPYLRSILNGMVCSAVIASSLTLPSGAKAQEPTRMSALREKEILAASSSGKLDVNRARVIIDNDAAFASKLQAIKNAKESIRMSYYIWHDDYTSSVLAEALIGAAKRGVKVSLLLDYHTNYKFLDLLSAMEREGRGNIQVRLFNRPTKNIVKDSLFMTSDCSPAAKASATVACSNEKQTRVDQLLAGETSRNISNRGTFFSKLFLSGMYSKSSAAIQTAVIEGGNISLEALKGGAGNSSADEKEQLKEFAKLLFDARMRGSLSAKIKLYFAFQIYGEDIMPIYSLMTSLIPIERERDQAAIKDWKHLTDFTHHKLLAVDDKVIQLGGRNIEDSYHMKPHKLVQKYLFMDTDMWVELKSPQKDVANAYDRLFNFKDMVATLDEVRQHAPNDMIQNPTTLIAAINSCASVKPMGFDAYDACVDNRFAQLPQVTASQRMDQALEKMRKNANTYRTDYKASFTETWKEGQGQNDFLSEQDVKSMLATYIENLHYTKNDKAMTRKYGVSIANEEASGKYIHSLMNQSLENACKVSAERNEKTRVILHQGYVFMPSNLMISLGRMLNGQWDCRNVDVIILTNSSDTTDLNIINFFARHQLAPLVKFAKAAAENKVKTAARVRILEYLKPAVGANLSLHSKVNIIGDDMILGSANADVRSYYMDTNNGFFVRGAKDFTREYSAWVGRLAADATKVRDITKELASKEADTLLQEDAVGLDMMGAKFKLKERLTAEQFGEIVKLMFQNQNYIRQSSEGFLDKNKIEAPYWFDENDMKRVQGEQQIKIGDDFNSYFEVL